MPTMVTLLSEFGGIRDTGPQINNDINLALSEIEYRKPAPATAVRIWPLKPSKKIQENPPMPFDQHFS
jgi:hypothetical protein